MYPVARNRYQIKGQDKYQNPIIIILFYVGEGSYVCCYSSCLDEKNILVKQKECINSKFSQEIESLFYIESFTVMELYQSERQQFR